MLENNINNQQKLPQFQAVNPQTVQGQQVPMQAINPELLKQNVQDSYVSNRVSETTDDPQGMIYTGLLAIPSWFAIAKGMDKFSEKTRGDYNNTIYHKVGQFGDDITNAVKNSAFGRSAFGQSINKGFKNLSEFFRKNLIDRFRITRAMAYTPSRPENAMVLSQADGMLGFLAGDYQQVVESFLRPSASVDDLVRYGADADDIRKYKDLYARATSPEARAIVLENAEFECLSKYTRKTGAAAVNLDSFTRLSLEERIKKLKEMKAFEFGAGSLDELEKLKTNVHSNTAKIIEVSSNANKRMFARAFAKKNGLLNWIKFNLLNRDVYASEFSNKMAASVGNMDLNADANKAYKQALESAGLIDKIPKSALGRFLNKYMNIVLEGATNRVAGGKIMVLMQAFYFADVLYKSMKADGVGEKLKSFAERFTEMIAFFACMPMAIKLMHSIGGLQYAGMTKEQVELYRQHLKAHNMKAMSGGFANKIEWKVSKDKLVEELNAGVKNPITKLFKRIGRIVTVGLEQIRPYDKTDIGVMKDGVKTYRKGVWNKLKDLWRHPKFGIKQMAGYPMRIGLGMMIIMPFLGKLAVKGSHLLFGKPKNSLLDEGKEKPQEQQQPQSVQQTQLPPQLQQPMQQQPVQQTTATQSTTTVTQPGQSPSNLLNKYQNGSTTTTTTTTQTQTQTTTPNLSAPNEPVRTYIPSPLGVQIINQQEDTSAADQAMLSADKAAKLAMQTLKMN